MPKLWLFFARARDVLAVDRTPMVLILSGLIAFVVGCMASDLRHDLLADILCVGGVALCAVGYELLRLRAG